MAGRPGLTCKCPHCGAPVALGDPAAGTDHWRTCRQCRERIHILVERIEHPAPGVTVHHIQFL